MAIKNTPRGLRVLDDILTRLVIDLRLPAKLGSYPINIKTIFLDAATLIFTEESEKPYGLPTIHTLDKRLVETYAENLYIGETRSDDAVNKVDVSIIENIFVKLCVLEFGKKLAVSNAMRKSIGMLPNIEEHECEVLVDFANSMSRYLIDDYKAILRAHGLGEDETSKDTVIKDKTTTERDVKEEK